MNMNTPPTHPHPGPAPPANIPAPPYTVNVQVQDPPAQPPPTSLPPIPVLDEQNAPRSLALCWNVRTTMLDTFLGVHINAVPVGHGLMTMYRTMSKPRWTALLNNTTQDNYPKLLLLLRNIWLSCYHHQQQIVLGGGSCTVYALPRAGWRVWLNVIPVLLAAFQVQWYLEDKERQASLWADFATSARPHMHELIGAVIDALAVVIWYRPV